MTIDSKVYKEKYEIDYKWFEPVIIDDMTTEEIYREKAIREKDIDFDNMTDKEFDEYIYLHDVTGRDILRKDTPPEIKARYIAFCKLLDGDEDADYEGVQSMYYQK